MKLKYFVLIFIYFILICAPVSAEAGDQFELKSISFQGNKEISTGTLKSIINSQETPWWFWKFINSFTSLGNPPAYFDSTSIASDLVSIKEFYEANGYFKTKITYSYKADTSSHNITLLYNINEGPASLYGFFSIRGLRSVPDPLRSELLKLIKLDSTKQFNQQNIVSAAGNLVTTLTNNGYMEAKFDSTIIYKDTLHNRADLSIFFTTGLRYTIDSVIVEKKGEGAELVDNDLIKKLSGFQAGEFYNLEKIKKNQAILFRTSIFTSLSMSASLKDTTGDMVPLKIEGNIGTLNELGPELIINNQNNAFNVGLGASYIKKNFLGDARKLSLNSSFGISDIFRADIAHLGKRFSFRDTTLYGYVDTRAIIEQPNLFDKDIYGTLVFYLQIQKLHTLNTTIYGTRLTFEFQLPSHTFINQFSMYYNIEQVNELYTVLKDSLYRSLISIIGFNFGKSTADDILFPTQGYNISLIVEEADLIPYLFGKLIKNEYTGTLFYKLTWTNAYYYGFGTKKNIIFASKLKLGHLQPYLHQFEGVPNNRTFYTGGSNSLRGWRSNQFPGLDVKGGGFLLEGTFELRYRFLQNIGSAIFFDYGNEWRNYTYFRYKEIALDIGAGLRYYTSVAPFRLDFGVKLYDPSNRRNIFHKNFWNNIEVNFGIGEAF